MKISKLYSDWPKDFPDIVFREGLNAVLAEIRLPENRSKDTHNLGKSTLAQVLDFGFLLGKDNKFFLFKHFESFKRLTFFLEVQLPDESYLTIRRSVAEATKISFKKHQARDQDYTSLEDEGWDHLNMSFDRARDMLDGLLDWRALKPWSFRMIIGYLLRSQDDYQDVFQLKKYQSSHADWKPFLAHLLGFDAKAVQSLYEVETRLVDREAKATTIRAELGGSIGDLSKIEGILLLKQKDAEKKQALLDVFDFRTQDRERVKLLAEDVDEKLAELNARRYSLTQSRKKVIASLDEGQILFDPEEAASLFREAGVVFSGQLKRDFEQLIEFNRAITEERRAYLLEERAEVEAELKKIGSEITSLGKRRSDLLAFLTSSDSFDKYKRLSSDLVALRADIMSLERQRGFLHRLQELRTEIRDLTEERVQLQTSIESDVEAQNADGTSRFSTIRLYFSEIIEQVIDRKALLSVAPNHRGHLEFRADILDESGNATSAGLGHTYRKLLCIAFDLAVLRSHTDEPFPRFVFHDGVFESLDDRKKQNLLEVIRGHCEIGLQHIITMIDSDMPTAPAVDEPVFSDNEVTLVLHDEGPEGRLFKTPSW